MRKIQEVLRLHAQAGLSERTIAKSVSLSRSTVAKIISRSKEAGIAWPLPADMDDSTLEAMLFPVPLGRPKNCFEPEWNHIHQELKRKGVTLQLLWMEYKEQHQDGYQYSQFCDRYRVWKKQLQISMRHEHRAGEKMFVDYSGPTLPVIDRETGEVQQAQVFVAVLGASNYTFAEAHPSQNLESFITGHVHAFEFFGGVPELIVPDNLKSAVFKADRYEPTLNRTYQEMAAHYGCAILPTRPRKPKDKPKAEVGVQIVERWIMAVLRNQLFFSFYELNQTIRQLVERLNAKPFQKLEGSRRSLFSATDKLALRPLPPKPYAYADWKLCGVHIDYHIEIHRAFYSVPYSLVGQKVDARITHNTVEIFFKGKRVASHARVFRQGEARTDPLHRPKSHQKHLEWTPSRLIEWGTSIGPNTGILVERILLKFKHPEQGYRSCLGLLSLSKQYPEERMEAACLRALSINSPSYRSVKSILQNGLDKAETGPKDEQVTPSHGNIRGSSYYQTTFHPHLQKV